MEKSGGGIRYEDFSLWFILDIFVIQLCDFGKSLMKSEARCDHGEGRGTNFPQYNV